jgi:hypothetical protein
MNNNYKLTESCKYNLGEKHYKWTLYTALYQHYDNYYYVIFDNEDAENVIISSVVTSSTINTLEQTILDTMIYPAKLETIDDIYAA